jgi:hypothetical protein
VLEKVAVPVGTVFGAQLLAVFQSVVAPFQVASAARAADAARQSPPANPAKPRRRAVAWMRPLNSTPPNRLQPPTRYRGRFPATSGGKSIGPRQKTDGGAINLARCGHVAT